MMEVASRTIVAVLLTLDVVLASACSSAKPPVSTPQTEGHRTIAQGYSLLYAIASQQKDTKKLLLVKTESDSVDQVITGLSDYTAELCAQLEDMARRYPAITVDTQFLPEVEVKARESITSETTKRLLSSKGKQFERQLLLKQASALEEEQHISKVMLDLETAGERREFWRRTDAGLGAQRDKIAQLLARDYFSK